MAGSEKRRLKIGLVLDTSLDPADGVQQYVISVGEWLRSEGHDVHYLVGQTEKRDLPNIHSLARNVAVRFNGNRTTIPLPTSKHRLREVLDREQFDVLHVQIPHSPFMAGRLITAADKRVAVIGTFHIAPYNHLVTIGNRLLGWWLRPSLNRFDRIVSVSSAAADFAQKTFGIKTEILPNVIDYERFHSAEPFSEYADGVLSLLFLGRLVPRKGCLILLQAVARLSADPNIPPFRVLICGRGPLEASVRSFVTEHGLEKIAVLAGFVSEEDKPRYYASADISVFPSSAGESFGIVLLEAMASGRAAVLGGDNPGYRSVLAPHEELLFNPKDVTELTGKLKKYILHTDTRQAAAKWGETYSEQFDINAVGLQILNYYYEALRKREKPEII